MRYQLIDTLTGEIVKEQPRHPMLTPLKRKPRYKRTRRPVQASKPLDDVLVALCGAGVLCMAIALTA